MNQYLGNIVKIRTYEDVPAKRPPVATEPSYYGGENEHIYTIAFLECVLQLSYNIKRSAATAKLSSSLYVSGT